MVRPELVFTAGVKCPPPVLIDIAEAASARIVHEVHDEPHIEGRRVTVRHVRALVEERGESPVNVAEELDLSLTDVYAPLHYYHAHPEEMRRVERERQATIEGHRRLTTDPDDVRE
jgi:uncharacterized protein (DUF433 family)